LDSVVGPGLVPPVLPTAPEPPEFELTDDPAPVRVVLLQSTLGPLGPLGPLDVLDVLVLGVVVHVPGVGGGGTGMPDVDPA
jgi:hypothetical protein